jgi:molybdopterin adenylyltransferase
VQKVAYEVVRPQLWVQRNAKEFTDMTASIPIGVVTVSDRASAGIYEDRGGPAIIAELRRILRSAWHAEARVIADERPLIGATLVDLADRLRCPLIVTTGGTGPAKRDVTPEATEDVCEKMMPGFGELMRSVSLNSVPTAILSRQTAGIRGSSLIVNLPGKPSAIAETLTAVFPAIPYCIDLIGGDRLETDPAECQVFRPQVIAGGKAST